MADQRQRKLVVMIALLLVCWSPRRSEAQTRATSKPRVSLPKSAAAIIGIKATPRGDSVRKWLLENLREQEFRKSNNQSRKHSAILK